MIRLTHSRHQRSYCCLTSTWNARVSQYQFKCADEKNNCDFYLVYFFILPKLINFWLRHCRHNTLTCFGCLCDLHQELIDAHRCWFQLACQTSYQASINRTISFSIFFPPWAKWKKVAHLFLDCCLSMLRGSQVPTRKLLALYTSAPEAATWCVMKSRAQYRDAPQRCKIRLNSILYWDIRDGEILSTCCITLTNTTWPDRKCMESWSF